MATAHTLYDVRNGGHWTIKNHRQRMTHAQWSKLLLRGDDSIIYRDKVVSLVSIDLGYGVVEVTKDLTDA